MNNTVGLHISSWWGTPIANDIYQIIEYSKKSGAQAMELHPPAIMNLSVDQRKDLRKFLDSHGLALTINGGVGAHNDISSSDPNIRKAGIEWSNQLLKAIKEVGSKWWSGCFYAEYLGKPNAEDIPGSKLRTKERAVESLRKISAVAAEYDITCCLEVLNRYEQYMFNTVREGVSFCEEVDNSHCKLLIDIYHMNIEEDNIADSIIYGSRAAQIGYIHVGESNRRIPTGGPSNINWREIANAFSEASYEGMLILEPFEFSLAHNAMRVCTWRDHADANDLDGLVARLSAGIEFIQKVCNQKI